jgi:DNA-binding IclR family transcriptional regulator
VTALAAEAGTTFPLHCPAKGRAILAAYCPGLLIW